MADRIDVDELKGRISLEEMIIACGVDLKKQGNELKGLCPFHDEKTPSFTVTPSKESYYCFGCAAGGDHVQFLKDLYGCDFNGAIEKLQELVGGGVTAGPTRAKRQSVREPGPEDKWKFKGAGPEVDPLTSIAVTREGRRIDCPVIARWAYRDKDGGLLGYTYRIEPEPGKKEIIPRTYMVNHETGSQEMRAKSLPEPRSLYGAELLTRHPESNVILVEGEKAADALRRMIPIKMGLVLTWPGGGKAVKKADWSMLAGRKIIGWPDCDSKRDKKTGELLPHHEQPGTAAMLDIAEQVRHHGAGMSIIRVPDPGELDDGWDAADAELQGWTKSDVVEFIKSNKRSPEDIVPASPTSPTEESASPATGNDSYAPFRPLGYSGNSYFYLPTGTEQVCEIKRGSHTSPSEMLSIAPLAWWEFAHPKEKSPGPDWYQAADACMRACELAGIYSPDRERGRGAWYDKGKSVLHLGSHLLVDGKSVDISAHRSSFIYTRQAPLEHGADSAPATDEQSIEVAEMFEELNWNKPVYAQMAAGWCLLAPICGALPWRPHIWITAQRGAGKSWIQDHIIQPLLGPSALMVQGSTTEAGIRQKLKQDARPIVFDEAEGEDQKSQNRMQTVIELARQSSSDSSAEIIKGTVNGNGMAFRMRSMFMLGSVNVLLHQAADESRFTVISLGTPDKTPDEVARFDAFSKRVDNTLTQELCASLRARAYTLMPVIRANARTFSRAVAELLGSQRIGDQIGTLIAGSCAYYRSDEISLDDARKWVSQLDFEDAKEQEQVSDEESCLQRILQSQIRFDSDRGQLNRAVGELVDCAHGVEQITGILASDANDILKRYGMYVDGSYLVIANKHAELERLLKDTPWGAGWRRILGRIPGSSSTSHAVRFAGAKSRGVQIPIGFFR